MPIISPAAVFFDLDGTLLDTAGDFHLILNELRQQCGAAPLSLNTVRPWVSEGSQCMITQGSADLTLTAQELESLRLQFLERYAEYPARQSTEFPGISNVLQTLEYQSIPWGIVTNKPSRFTLPLLKALNLHPATVICPDMLVHSKPDPEGLIRAAAEVGKNPEQCYYVGDHRRDIEAGLRAHMTTVIAAWGYIPATENTQLWGAHYTVPHARALQDLLMH